ncbi:MAG: hypothetical protein JOY66_01930 [Acetobacteraceae bacterium]|nr:hypothetical protein [Acetobacteraceae bacterium]
MHNVFAVAAASAVVVLLSTAAAATQEAGAPPKVLLAQAIQQGDPAARPDRGPRPETSAGDKSAPPASPDQAAASTNQPTVKQKEEAQRLGQEVK